MEGKPPSTSAGQAGPSDGQPPAQIFDNSVFVPRVVPPPPPPQPALLPSFVSVHDLRDLRELAVQLRERKSKKGELSSEARIAIITALACGIPRKTLSDVFDVSSHTVRAAQDRWEKRQSVASRPRSGRPKKLTPEDEKALLEASKDKKTNVELAKLYNVSTGTIRRVLRKEGIVKPPGGQPLKRTSAAAAAAAAEPDQQMFAAPKISTSEILPPAVPRYAR